MTVSGRGRLLTLFASHDRGGAEEYALTVGRAALESGWEVHAAFPRVPGTASLVDDFTGAGIRYHVLDARAGAPATGFVSRCRRDVGSARACWRLSREIRPSLVHITVPSVSSGLGGVLACGAQSIPAVVVFQAVARGAALVPWRRALWSLCRRRGQRWVVVSSDNRTLLSRALGVPTDELTVIHNGVPLGTDLLKPALDDARESVREELGLESGCRILLTVGRLEDHKGYPDLLSAAARVAREFPRVVFVWVGEGSLRPSLERTLETTGLRGRVILAGHRRDVPRLLAAADLFVFPTHFEGLPFSVLEAMAAGLPVVASDASSLPEIIRHDRDGILFAAGDAEALRRALIRALGNPETMRQLAENARARAEEYSETKMTRRTLGLFEEWRPGRGNP